MASARWGLFRTVIVVGLLLLIAACDASPESTAGSSSVSTNASTTTSSSTTEVPGVPPTTASGVELSEGAVTEVMDQYAFPADAVYPTGTVQWIEWLAFCNAAFGFSFEVISEAGQDPHLYGQVPLAQQDLQLRVSRACQEAALDQGYFFPIVHTEEFGGRVYAGFLEVHSCMVSNGFPVTEPPSEETFLADWIDGGRHWHPYDATPFGSSLSVSPDAEGNPPENVTAQLEIQATCPADWGSILDP